MKPQGIFSNNIWRRLAITAVLFVGPLFLFVQLADEVRERETLRVDEAILRAVNATSTSGLDVAVVILTQLGGAIGVTVITLGLVSILWRRKMRRMAVLLLAGVGGSVALNLLLKTFFQRDRPELWERLVTENSYSFPSGHAMASSALAFSLMVIFWPTRWRWVAIAAGGAYVTLIGLSRLYLGVHYPTDVAAGWLVSGAWVVVVATALRYSTWSKPEIKKL